MIQNKLCLKAENITFERQKTKLIQDLSWEVPQGSHWAILGPNGAGKTLLLRLLMGYLWPTQGKIEILGHTLGKVDLRVLRRRLAWVAKALEEITPPETSVLKVILSGPESTLGLYSSPSQSMLERAENLAEAFRLTPILKRAFGLLSSGEKQRVLLARASLAKPEILFLDEPMANLDLGGREEFLKHLGQLVATPNPPTIILATHNTLEIAPFIDHVLFLKEGEVLAAGLIDQELTNEMLQRVYDLPLQLERTASGRYLAYL